jgi:DNA-binding NarL/FixJ family response regulator
MVITVSIIDDQVELSQFIAEYINTARGFRCLSTHATAEEALQALPTVKPDVVLMDINLNGMSGIECVEKLKVSHPEMLVLMLTVYEDSDLIFRALAAGASGYLLKRSPPSKLLEAIAEVHAGGSPMSSAIARRVVSSFQKPAGPPADRAALSPREKEVIEALARGDAYKQIADRLGITIPTVRTYIRRIYEKLHVHTRTEAVAKYLRP